MVMPMITVDFNTGSAIKTIALKFTWVKHKNAELVKHMVHQREPPGIKKCGPLVLLALPAFPAIICLFERFGRRRRVSE